MGSRLIKVSVHNRAFRDRNQSAIIVEHALQCFLGPCNNLAMGASQ